jgi:hypothetical protein
LSADCSSTKKIESNYLHLYGTLKMTTYNEILKSADPTCCHRKKKTSHLGIAIENTFFALLCAWATFVAAKMEYLAAAKILTLATFYMIAATSTYIGLMILYKPPKHLNYDSEEVDYDSDSESVTDVQGDGHETDESDDDMPPLVPIVGYQTKSQEDRVLRQLQQVVDDTNARNQVRMTRSMYAKSAAGMASDASYKKLS